MNGGMPAMSLQDEIAQRLQSRNKPTVASSNASNLQQKSSMLNFFIISL